MVSMEWHPILDGELLERAHHSLESITTALSRLESHKVDRGKSDIALYFAYLARAGGGLVNDARASTWLDAAMEDAATHPLSSALYGGCSGVAWAVSHVSQLLREEPDADHTREMADGEPDSNSDIDELLVGFVGERPWSRSYDLIGGLVGLGIYFIERLPRSHARAGLEEIIHRLSEIAKEDADGIYWHTPPEQLPRSQRKLAPDGYYNLGVAHGIPGIIALLAYCVSYDVATSLSGRLLSGAMSWLLAHQRSSGSDYRFPSWIAIGHGESGGPRLAWCYGDPGVAAVMFSAGMAASETSWTNAATHLAIECAERPGSRSRNADAGLCHGAAGVAHIFNRLFQATGNERLRSAAREWFSYTLDMRNDKGYGGFQSYFPANEDGVSYDSPWRDDASLLTGSAGIGLALLAGSTTVPPEWDRLLVTCPPVSRTT